MRQLTRLSVLSYLLFFSALSYGQPKFYLHDTTVKVIAYGQEQTLAFCGGFNNPQFAMADLNHDGLPDMVVFEPWNSLRTFINEGTAGNPNYRYAPEYALNFPPLFDYINMQDYNCDGIPDLFDRGSTGFEVYKGYYNGLNQLCFTFYQQLFYNNDLYAGGPANAYCNPGDIPAIVDIDGDGDLDFIAYDISGGWINLYKNMRVEMGLPCDSIHIALKDRCWGRVWQGYYREHQLHRTCDESHLLTYKPVFDGGKKTHSGNTPCLFDWDMDGDYDYLDGSVSWNEMTFLKNGRIEAGSGPDSMISQDTMWQTGGKTIEMPTFPAAFNVDFDQDGKKDLLIAPNAPGYGSENYKCIWYYKNFTTAGSPDWRFQSDSFITDKTIDLGTAAYPMFFDYDKDGKPDMFIGSDGYYQAGGTLQGRLSYYRNTGTAGAPSFTLQTRDMLGLSAHNFGGVAPAFGDIDGDGKSDLVIGHTDGTLSYYKNIAATDSVTPNWQLQLLVLTDMNGDTINVGGHAAPFIYDLDHDGKKDLIIGNIFGYIQYYQNVATTPGTIKLKLINTQLGHAKVDTTRFYGNDAAPFIGKIDSTGIEYLLVGSNSGAIYRFTGFQGGDTTAWYTMLDAQYSFIDTTYSLFHHPGTQYGIYDNLRSTVAVGDIANDGNYYMLVGNNKGGVDNYKLKAYTPLVDHSGVTTVNENGKVQVYPNPAKDVLNVSWSGVLQSEVQISFMNMAGQILYTAGLPTNPDHTSLSVSMLPSGMYVCLLQSGVNRYYSKFTVIR
jgi:Secretion system C-terminal sorting domain/FG-GAP-like repeat